MKTIQRIQHNDVGKEVEGAYDVCEAFIVRNVEDIETGEDGILIEFYSLPNAHRLLIPMAECEALSQVLGEALANIYKKRGVESQ